MSETKKNSVFDRAIRTSEKIENIFVVKVIRDGLVTMIPILMIGAFALVLKTFPVDAYQNFIQSFAGGFFYSIFHMIYQATFGIMSVYMSISFSISYFSHKNPDRPVNMWGTATSLVSFMIMVGVWHEDFSISDLGTVSAFLALTTAIVSSGIFYFVSKKLPHEKIINSYGADSRLGNALGAIFSGTVPVITAALISFFITLTDHSTMHELVTSFFVAAFGLIDNLFFKGLAFIFVSSLLWLFGIHGSDCLQGVSDSVFTPLMNANIQAVADGNIAREILCKPFFDCYILMGGCGSSICLFLAILLFSKNKGMRTIAKTAALPLLFNINELIVFGLPIVFNPLMVIPFLLVPVIQYLIAYSAIAAGLVPCITSAIEWTTPVFISGFAATGSFAAVILQLINILIGVAIYTPFVMMMGKARYVREERNKDAFIKWFIKEENTLENTRLSSLRGIYGDLAKSLSLELIETVQNDKLDLYYQPQYDYEGNCTGVEALLRLSIEKWPRIYPPLLIKLAREQGILMDLEKRILARAMSEREQIFSQFGHNIKISVNVTGSTISSPEYWDYLKNLFETTPFTEGSLCIEITERDAIVFTEDIIENFRECKTLGIKFAIDDFSAGQTSIEYLKNGIFDILKLDGSLVCGVVDNSRCRDIIQSLVTLADSLNIGCIAEFVETEAIRDTLHEIGCNTYQGYLYSPAVALKKDN